MKKVKYHNWSVDEKAFKKADPEKYKIWQLEQAINYGTDYKISKKEIKKNWSRIKENIDPYKKRYLEFILWQKQYLLPDKLNFWNWSIKTRE